MNVAFICKMEERLEEYPDKNMLEALLRNKSYSGINASIFLIQSPLTQEKQAALNLMQSNFRIFFAKSALPLPGEKSALLCMANLLFERDDPWDAFVICSWKTEIPAANMTVLADQLFEKLDRVIKFVPKTGKSLSPTYTIQKIKKILWKGFLGFQPGSPSLFLIPRKYAEMLCFSREAAVHLEAAIERLNIPSKTIPLEGLQPGCQNWKGLAAVFRDIFFEKTQRFATRCSLIALSASALFSLYWANSGSVPGVFIAVGLLLGGIFAAVTAIMAIFFGVISEMTKENHRWNAALDSSLAIEQMSPIPEARNQRFKVIE